ncbi:hypothetical protein IWW36_003356 [Coemansia brasiliensis]|uniref:RanBD1 domain-containing protein n=1 Tax=Coemansia brasiliensis TaxID=2650707 RepID=A0A9W8LZU6_9FUNG|nr:hypothetical protein IWW36_003356 [Coemansia brasiliensis]
MGLIKNNPKSIMLAWAGVIAIGFGTFVYAKDLVSNDRRAENIRRIKRERRMLAYREYNQQNEEKERERMKVASVENKRKRQESVHGEKVLLKQDEEAQEAATEPVAEQDASEQPAEPAGSSPAKRPRTSEDGNEEDEEPVSTETPAEPASKAPVFGMTFSSSRSLGGFASAAKGPSPLAKFASATATSGFAKYAKTQQPQSPTDKSSEPTEAPNAEAAEKPKTFEDMLTADGKQSLATNAAMTTMVPAMAQTQVGETETLPIRTYEEDETCIYSTKAKLFEFASNAWKERGSGQFKINQHNDNRLRRRLVMRMEQTFRLILNVRLFAAMKLSCERRFVRFTCIDPESAAPVTFALRFASEPLAAEAYQQISDAIPEEDSVNPDNGKLDNEDKQDSSDDGAGSEDAADEAKTAGKGKAAESADADVQDSDDEEEDEDYVASGSESGDNELDSDAVDSEDELNSDDESSKAASSK